MSQPRELLRHASAFVDRLTSSTWVHNFKDYNTAGSIWTYEIGCLLYTSITVYNLLFGPEPIDLAHKLVIALLILGTTSYFGLHLLLHWVNASVQSYYTQLVLTANTYLFMGLSFLPGLYFAFYFEEFINRVYFWYHIIVSSYLLYKRFKSFQLQPFLVGLALSFGLVGVFPAIHWILALGGSGWFWTTISSTLETLLHLALAVALMLRLPEKYLPPNVMFGLKIAKYLMFWSSWETWFILMVISTWKNLGSAWQATMEGAMVKNQQEETQIRKDGHKL